MTLPDAELSFYLLHWRSLSRRAGPIFTERVTRLLGAHPNPGPGDVDRAVRQALVGLRTPPAIEEFQRPPRWNRATPTFEWVSKRRLVSCGALVDSVWAQGGWYIS